MPFAEVMSERTEQNNQLLHYRFGFAQEIFQQANQLGMINKKMKLNPIPSSEFPTPVKRPANSKLDGKKLQQHFDLLPADWKHDLSTMLKNINNEFKL